MSKDRKLLAVLIDADNIPAKSAADILKEITTYGEPALRRVYGDWSSTKLSGWKKVVMELGLVANQETANTTHKNASDIGLVIDAMDILHTGRFDGFVIVSSDSDFTALANRLRENGVEVIGIGEAKAPDSLRNVCNRFVLIENLTEPDDVKEQAVIPKRSATNKPKGTYAKDRQVNDQQAKDTKHPPSKAVPLVLKAMQSMDPEAEWYGLSALGKIVNRAYPDFDHRTYGSTKLSDLLKKTGQFDVDTNDGKLEVRRKS
jgi:uncharacterized protein (TIGR00288 family)